MNSNMNPTRRLNTAAEEPITLDLILIDDEPAILDGLEKTYDWASYGFRVVGTARSGERGLSLAKNLNPDVVMTDVRMKKMDGLELIRRCQEYDQTLEFVIVSAHNEFRYAQQACALGVFSYLLKPIDESQLSSVMNELHSRCMSWRNQRREIEQFRHFITEGRCELEELLLKKLLTRAITPPQFLRQLQMIDSKLSNTQKYCVICLDVNVAARVLSGVDIDARRFVLTRPIIEELSVTFAIRSFELSDGRVIVVVVSEGDDSDGDGNVRHVLQKLTHKTKVGARASTVATNGRFLKGVSGMMESCDQALASFEYHSSVGADSNVVGSGLFDPPSQTQVYPREEALEIIRGIRLNDHELFSRHLAGFGDAIATTDHMSRCICFQRLCADVCLYLMETVGIRTSDIERLARYSEHTLKLTSDELAKVLAEIVDDLILYRQEYQFSQTSGPYDSRIHDVLLFIDMNLGEEGLSIRDAADHVCLNMAYFGRLFSKVTGVSFNEHVSRKRIEAASELLNSADLTVQEISDRVGMSSSSYFSTVFKKHTGMNPSDYRKNA